MLPMLCTQSGLLGHSEAVARLAHPPARACCAPPPAALLSAPCADHAACLPACQLPRKCMCTFGYCGAPATVLTSKLQLPLAGCPLCAPAVLGALSSMWSLKPQAATHMCRWPVQCCPPLWLRRGAGWRLTATRGPTRSSSTPTSACGGGAALAPARRFPGRSSGPASQRTWMGGLHMSVELDGWCTSRWCLTAMLQSL